MMKSKIVGFALLAIFLFPAAFQLKAEGISVDAGLTPAQDRIIVRLQYRNLIRTMDGNDLVMHMIPLVVAYGLSPDITLMMRNGFRAVGTNETMMPMENQWMDPFFMGKVKLFRRNTRTYTLGLAGFAGTSFPVLGGSISKSYSPVLGVNASYRVGYWSFDLNNAFEWIGYSTAEKQAEDKQYQLNLAISRNFLLEKFDDLVFAPVQEFSFVRSSPETGGAQSFGFISPGFQIVSPHIKFEGLYQIPVNPSGTAGLKNGSRLILGMRFMF
jgi:hypothetical protein